MNEVNEKARSALVALAVKIMQLSFETLHELHLWALTENEEEIALVMEELGGSQVTKLQTLNLGRNKTWFAEIDNVLIVADFIGRQEKLQVLILNCNELSSEATDELLTQLAQCKAIKTIEEIELWESANFDSDVAVQALANMVATAPRLKQCNI